MTKIFAQWFVMGACMFLASSSVAQDRPIQRPISVPTGFDKTLSEVEISGDYCTVTIDCMKFYEATELWLKATDPAKKQNAKVRLQETLESFFSKLRADPNFENLPDANQSKFRKRLAEVLIGGELEQTEIQAGKSGKTVRLHTAYPLGLTLREVPDCYRRNNDAGFIFEWDNHSARGGCLVSLFLSPVTPETSQVFTSLSPTEENEYYYDIQNSQYGLGLRGLLLSAQGKIVSKCEARNALAGCFDGEGRVLLVRHKDGEQSAGASGEAGALSCSLELRSSKGETVWTRLVNFPSTSQIDDQHWSVWASAGPEAWIVEMWSLSDHGAFEAMSHCWEVRNPPNIQFRKIRETSFLKDKEVKLLQAKMADKSFRFSRSTVYHSADSNGEIGFETGFARHGFTPLYMEGYKRPVAETENCLCFRRASDKSFLRNTWATSKNFFVASECFWPLFGRFSLQREGTPWEAQYGDPDWTCDPRGESATFFYNPSGDLQAWSMGFVAGDAEDGESLLVARTSGQLLTISPDYRVKSIRRFVGPDGAEAKPLLMLDSHHAGIFLIGKSIVVGTWQPPLLERLFPPAGKRKDNARQSQKPLQSASSRESRS